VDRACIDYYLYKGDMEGIKKHLKSFMEQPVESIDFFIPVLDKIMYYGYTDLALSISSKLYYEVKDAKGLIPGAEGEYFKIIYDERHHKMYTDIKNGLTIDMDKEKAYFEKYDYEFEKWELDRMQYFWSDDEPKKYTFEDYVSNREHFANDILYMFCDYTHKKNISFAAAYDIWDIGFNSFEMNMEEAELSNNFNDIFALDKGKYDNEISYRIDEIFSNKVTVSFAVTWGMVYMYDFLYEYGLISDEVYEDALITIDMIRNDVIIARATDMWEYGFINKWGMTDGIQEEEYKSDREIIKDSFTSIIKFEPVDDYEELEGEVLNDSMDTEYIVQESTIKPLIED